jgi:hypothetical protein
MKAITARGNLQSELLKGLGRIVDIPYFLKNMKNF